MGPGGRRMSVVYRLLIVSHLSGAVALLYMNVYFSWNSCIGSLYNNQILQCI